MGVMGADGGSVAFIVGIDVSKDRLDVFESRNSRASHCRNDEKGWAALVTRFVESKPDLIVMEASGGYERQVAAELVAVGLPVSVVNPRQVRDFAKAAGKLAKTDAVDARMLALFGERMEPRKTPLKTETQQLFASMVERRRQIVEMIVAEKNRLQQAPVPLRAHIQAHLDWLKQEQKRQDEEIEKHLDDEKNELKPIVTLLRSIKSIGPVVAATLVADLPELGTVTKRQIAALVGLAPFNRDSGQMKGQRSIMGGRAKVRKTLYMAAIVAIRRNETLKAFYERLLQRGKAKKAALTAVMRKLLVMANAVVRPLKAPKLAQIAP
jgi:transposase